MKRIRSRVFLAGWLFFIFFLSGGYPVWAELPFHEDELVTIYDDFDDGLFGRSEYRGVLRSVKWGAFYRSETLPVYSPATDEESFLTAVVLSAEKYERLRTKMDPSGLIRYDRKGLCFSFSLEKPGESLLAVIDEYYTGHWIKWRDPVRNHYLANYVIRIHSAENIFEPWFDTISYSEALLMATLVGDQDQWLWGIHDGADIFFR